MKTLPQLFSEYKSAHRAMPSFNIDSFEIFQSVVSAVKSTQLPCLVQLSAGEDKYFRAENLFLLVKKANLDGLPIFLNMDHCQDPERLEFLAHLGFDMLHFDGSKMPYGQNLQIASSLVPKLKSINPNLIVEVEFNHINLIEKGIDPDSYTSPEQAVEFMTNTNADLLAVSIGNLHGVSLDTPEKIDLDLLSRIAYVLPGKMFTLHGGSGISIEQVKEAINLGIVKININTDLRLQFKRSLIKSLTNLNTEKIYEYLNPVIDDVAKVAAQKLKTFSNQL